MKFVYLNKRLSYFVDTLMIICYNYIVDFRINGGADMNGLFSKMKEVLTGRFDSKLEDYIDGFIDFLGKKYEIYKTKNSQNGKGYSDAVYEIFEKTIQSTFSEKTIETIRSLLESTANRGAFFDYLIENSCYANGKSPEHEEDMQEKNKFIELISGFVNELYDDSQELAKWTTIFGDENFKVLLIEQMNQSSAKSDATAKAITDHFDKRLDKIEENYARTSEEPKPEESSEIKNDNGTYTDEYRTQLFLEEDYNCSECTKCESCESCTCNDYESCRENNVATLENVFVVPKLKESIKTVDIKLKSWANSETSRMIRKKIFLLYAKAGEGKTSLTSHILAKKIFGDKPCHALRLRRHIETLIDDYKSYSNAWKAVKKCFECDDDDKYKGSVVILDGLDEVYVIHSELKSSNFIQNLKNTAPDGVKILITSREGYLEEVHADNYLIISTLEWDESKLVEWCKKYAKIHQCRKDWCDNFPTIYNSIKEKELKEALCTPIILYICCVAETDISENSSVGAVYEDSFKKIAMRRHNTNHAGSDLTKEDARQFNINWQYTKELAFQMFLHDKLTEVVTGYLLDEVQKHTRRVLMEKKMIEKDEDLKPEYKKLPAVFHFVSEKEDSNNMRGLEFAHKTVGEYFTAVKLFEDYFEKLFADDDTDYKDVWRSIFGAFRYKKIPEDIMNYLVDVTKKRLTGQDEKSVNKTPYKVWCEKFFKSYYDGMMDQMLWRLISDEQFYKAGRWTLPEQVAAAFRNLTWFLTKLGFAKYDKENFYKLDENSKYAYRRTLGSYFVRDFNMDVRCQGWRSLRFVDFSCLNLVSADFRYTDLRNTRLNRATLNSALLTGASLRGADLEGTDLKGAKLIKIKVFESALPKFDKTIKEQGVELIAPRVYDDKTCELITDRVYDPKKNCMKKKWF